MKLRYVLSAAACRLGLTLGILALFASFVLQSGAASAQDMAFVRVVHASPDAGTVDVFADGAKLLSNFTFSSVTGYVSIAPGAHTLQVAPAGKGVGAAVITQSFTLAAGVPYTVAALGTTSTGFSLKAFEDNNLLSGGMAEVRVYHLSPNAGPVNVAAAPGGSPVITGLTYQNASGYLTVPPGAYNFQVTATQANATVPVPDTLKAGTVNSIFAVGLFQGNPALKFVSAAVPGVPGMPGTGSNPNAPAAGSNNGMPLAPWLLAGAAIVLIGGGVAARRFTATRQK